MGKISNLIVEVVHEVIHNSRSVEELAVMYGVSEEFIQGIVDEYVDCKAPESEATNHPPVL